MKRAEKKKLTSRLDAIFTNPYSMNVLMNMDSLERTALSEEHHYSCQDSPVFARSFILNSAVTSLQALEILTGSSRNWSHSHTGITEYIMRA